MIVDWKRVGDHVFTLAERASRPLAKQDPALPSGPSMPAALQTAWWLMWPNPFLELCRERFGPRFTLNLLTQPPMVFLSDPGEVKELLKAAPEVILPGEGGKVLEPALGSHSLITLDGDDHLEHRRLMAPAFHGAKIGRLSPLMESVTDRYLALMPRGKEFPIHHDLQSLTMEIILRATFGLPEGARLNRIRDLVWRAIKQAESPLFMLRATRTMPVLRWAWVPFEGILRQVDREIYTLIAERRTARAAGTDDSDGVDLLSVLLDARHDDGSPMTDTEIRDELLTMVVAGHETTASQIGWALLLLARNPAVQDRLHRELTSGADGGHDYLLATIQEVLRCDMATPHPEPRVVAQPVSIGGVGYRPGVILQAHGHLVHHDPQLYPDPETFRPERFLGSRPVPYAWIPFGGGRRRCIGSNMAMLEMQIVLRKILLQCEVRQAGAGVERGQRRAITSSPAGGAVVTLIDRQHSPVAEKPYGTGRSEARCPVVHSGSGF
ncbi:cytochrome P450 [Nocardia sp. CA-119907]|uniref:cytochrome P450 n=1 Tax=Nocardia sp. CA-119907 TaxID=3239973 RepID=UPI003D98F2FF